MDTGKWSDLKIEKGQLTTTRTGGRHLVNAFSDFCNATAFEDIGSVITWTSPKLLAWYILMTLNSRDEHLKKHLVACKYCAWDTNVHT
ncbi:hypothetical protein AVEN_73313-1 [Araneus ventricosus]|uniref:Uncharacterized protein n=1 Tax=Araneus ventricosus TaxID=182803 RepID=A0A4Y2H689_ARAVE|nr:hypothetical protein AVEN_73313-1 [Araneus ventricosus]